MALHVGGATVSLYRANDGCVKDLAGEAEPDESDVEHACFDARTGRQ